MSVTTVSDLHSFSELKRSPKLLSVNDLLRNSYVIVQVTMISNSEAKKLLETASRIQCRQS